MSARGGIGPGSRWILWDFDGTLALREGLWSRALLQTLLRHEPARNCTVDAIRPFLAHGFPWHSPDRSHEHLDTPGRWWDEMHPLFEAAFIGVDVAPGTAARLAREVRETYLDCAHWAVFPDVADTLERYAEGGWSHAVLSNHVPELDLLVAGLGLRRHFAHVFTSAVLGFEKPHPMAFERALAQLGCDRDGAWMVGDDFLADYEGARRSGLKAVLVRRSHPSADRCCATLARLPDFIPLES